MMNNNPKNTPPGTASSYHRGGSSSSRGAARVSASSSTSASAAVSSLDAPLDLDISQLLFGPLIAYGGHSRVLHGKYKDQDVAIKVIVSSEGSGSFEAGFEKHFIQEITLLSRLNHRRRQPISLEESVTFALDIAKGMEYLHSQGIIHRDLKPPLMSIATSHANYFRKLQAAFWD